MNDEKLIQLVRIYPALYDVSNAKYMDTDFKNSIWSKIGEEIKTNGTSCKSRWFNIRDNFRKSLKKKKKNASGQKAKKVKPYKYSEQLSFLKNFFEDWPNMSNIDVEVTSHDFKADDDVSESVLSENEENANNDLTEVHNPTTVEPQIGTSSNTLQIGPIPRKKTKQSVPNTHHAPTGAATIMEYLIKKKENIGFSSATPQHPVDAFLSGIAPALKQLPRIYWHYAKADIFAAVQNYDLKMLKDQQQFEEPYSDPIYVKQPSPAGSYHESTSTSSTQTLGYWPESSN